MTELTKEEQRKLIRFYYAHMGIGQFLTILEQYSKGWGYGDEYARYVFASYYEEWEEDYFGKEGIAYYIDNPVVDEDAEVILDYQTFYQFLRDDCGLYLQGHPQDIKVVNDYLVKIKEKYNIQ
ncbi:ribonuclease toxin immunity protein CdiI [Niallia taxi]|uniref:ribonuclease toxin immunity protein CdiI n=1 Tax=Niallia taxi TaxID=2499688 RepID=UPI003D29859C